MNRVEVNVTTGQRAVIELSAAEIAALQASAPPAPAPDPDYQGFHNALLVSQAYQVIRAQAATSQPLTLVAVEFIAAMGDAKIGRPNVAFLQGCLSNIAAAATDLDVAHWAEIGGLLSEHHLAGIYQLPGAGAGGSGSGG